MRQRTGNLVKAQVKDITENFQEGLEGNAKENKTVNNPGFCWRYPDATNRQ